MHIGIILDGNGRWASDKGLPRSIGHKRGAENVESILKECKRLNVLTVTLYAFSTENWNRPVYEVKALMSLFKYYLNKKLTNLHEENVRVTIIGEISPFPKIIKSYVKNIQELTESNDSMQLNLAMNYGGRDEIVRAAKKISNHVLKGKIEIDKIDENLFSNYLDTSLQSYPDLIIRTAGEKRLSNFLLWQSAYSELYFSEKTWPDFTESDLQKAIEAYCNRSRKFGKILEAKQRHNIKRPITN